MFKNEKGLILVAVYLVIAVLLILGTAFMSRSVSENRIAERERDAIKAFYVAEAGIDRVTRDLFVLFSANFGTVLVTPGNFNWFTGVGTAAHPDYTDASLPANTQLAWGVYTVAVDNVTVDTVRGSADVTLTSTGVVNQIPKVIKNVIRYQLGTSPVFDYPYFINNFGWLWGNTITTQGDIRSNGDFSFGNFGPTINGDIFASINPALGAAGDIVLDGNVISESIGDYRNNADATARPTNPTADPNPPNDYSYPDGYDGNSGRFPQQAVLPMPYLGNLQNYENLAVVANGSITQGGVVLVNQVFGDGPGEDGPDGINGTPDDGTIVLIGTVANPIVINGPVVVRGDVIIGGVVTGQGVIYSGRNTHIIDNITYANPPAWPKPDTNPAGTDTTNDGRDFLGLAAQSNIIMGDYTDPNWQAWIPQFIQPPFTQPYNTDPADAANGYDTDGDPMNGFRFDGDYTAFDGGTRDDGLGAGGAINRRYYESSLSDNFIGANANNNITRIDAVTYTNHSFSGRVGSLALNGSIVARDEAIVYTGNITMNYDVRARNRSGNFNLPRTLAAPQTISWEEN